MLSIGLLTLCSEEAHLKRGAHIAHSASLCSNYYPLMQVLEWFSACVVEREDLHPSNEQRVQEGQCSSPRQDELHLSVIKILCGEEMYLCSAILKPRKPPVIS
jgi:hypothetical protein